MVVTLETYNPRHTPPEMQKRLQTVREHLGGQAVEVD
jgi:hypothetical protein